MKKLITIALSFLLVFTAVACSNKEQAQPENTNKVVDKAYFNTYTGIYDKSIGTLSGYKMYTDIDTVNNAYKDKEYPGNEKYLNDVKSAYKDSKEKIQSFVDGLKNDAKTDDSELKKMNEDLISQGENLIKDIDEKMTKLDKITKNDYNKTQDEFIKLVDDTVKSGESIKNTFGDMLRKMNVRLGIDKKTIENNNTENTTK